MKVQNCVNTVNFKGTPGFPQKPNLLAYDPLKTQRKGLSLNRSDLEKQHNCVCSVLRIQLLSSAKQLFNGRIADLETTCTTLWKTGGHQSTRKVDSGTEPA